MIVALRLYVPANGKSENATFPSGQVVERNCGGVGTTADDVAAEEAIAGDMPERDEEVVTPPTAAIIC